MAVIAPCITVETPEDFQASVEKLKGFAERVHIDVSDGEFAPRQLVDPTYISWPNDWTVDIHAMVKNPRDIIQSLIILRPHTIILHAEIDDKEDLIPMLNYIRQNGVRPGLAFQRSSVPSEFREELRYCEHAMIFSGDLGHYGGKANMIQLEKVRLIKAIKPEIEMSWDGGVNIDNVYNLMQGGIDVLNAGGAINNADDPQQAYNDLVTEINRQSSII